ncbi:MAG TPA: NAD(P)H-binding protein [Streptosporangiaceae bacterium]|jgi:uncharacterized protein YbjT (DUF2867 family)
MTTEPVLVTGAAGGPQGSTGLLVTRLLLERGQAVRAFVHRDDERSAQLRTLGAEVVTGDLREITSVLPAVRGVRRAYFTYQVTDGLLDAAGAFAVAARQEGLERIVEVSQLAASPDAPTPRMRQHWVAEQVFDWAGVGAVHLRAAVFFENLAVLAAFRGGGELMIPLGPPSTVIPLVAAADVARVAAAMLTSTGDLDPVCRLTGEILTVGEAAERLGVPYVDIDPADWHHWALGKYRDSHTVEHLSRLWEIFRIVGAHHELYQVTEAIEQIGGHPPLTLREFAAS